MNEKLKKMAEQLDVLLTAVSYQQPDKIIKINEIKEMIKPMLSEDEEEK